MTKTNSTSIEELKRNIGKALFRFSVGEIDDRMSGAFAEQYLESARAQVWNSDPEYKLAFDTILDLFASTIEQIAKEGLPKYAKSIGMDVAQLWESPDATDGYNYAIDKSRTELLTISKLIREGEKR